jgi:hypothetical protein
VQLTQIEVELINAAHSEGQVDPTSFAGLLRHDLGDVETAISGLINRRLLAAEGNASRLTNQGEAVHRRQGEDNRAAVLRRTGSWQPR